MKEKVEKLLARCKNRHEMLQKSYKEYMADDSIESAVSVHIKMQQFKLFIAELEEILK